MVYEDSSSGIPAVLKTVLCIFDSIFELHTRNDFRQVVEPADSAPALLGWRRSYRQMWCMRICQAALLLSAKLLSTSSIPSVNRTPVITFAR